MHRFSVLIEGCVGFTTSRLDETIAEIESRLAKSGSSVLVKNLQSVRMQYTITAVGMFSVFDAEVQRAFGVADGFAAVRKTLTDKNETDLLERFEQFAFAVNVLKHGEGRSYDRLLEMQGRLPFRIKDRRDDFFEEGDCSEIDTLVEADTNFLKKSAVVIHEVCDVLGI